MAMKHHPRINPQTPTFRRVLVAALSAAVPLGLGLFILSLFVRNAPAVLATAFVAPAQLLQLLVLFVVSLLLVLLGLRLACKTTWASEAFYQWVKPGGYHWKLRGRISAAEARDSRRLMRAPAWANKAGLTREVFVKTVEMTDPGTGRKSLKDVYEVIYPRFKSLALNSEGVDAIITMQDGYESGVFAEQPGVTRAVHREQDSSRVWRVKRAAELKSALAIKGTHFQLLSRDSSAQAAPVQIPTQTAVPQQTFASPATSAAPNIYDFKREVLRETYDETYPVRNWLLYKLSGQDCDKLALANELAQVQALGFHASPDSMHSFWTTYKRAIQLWYGETFTLGHPTNNVQRLLELHDQGVFAEVNALFAPFATLAHARGNFMLMPVYVDQQTGRATRETNLNLVRNKVKSDYWDLTLAGIQSGEFRAFFGDNPVAPQFNIPAMPGGFAEFVTRHHLDMYFDPNGAVRPLWVGHLTQGAKCLPQTQEHVAEFITNACLAIEQRSLHYYTAR